MTGLGNANDVYKHYLKVIEENKQLEKKLEIAVKALEEYADENNWTEDLGYGYNNKFPEGSDVAHQALAKIKEIK